MGKRKVSILEPAVEAVAEIAFFIQGKGLSHTAKKFVDDVFDFFEKISEDSIEYRPCPYELWQSLNYRCVNFRKKYVVAYLSLKTEIVICEFVSAKLLK